MGDRQTYDGLLLQTGPAPQQTQYRFPCVVEGGTITLSWQKGQQRGCAEGLRIRPNPEGRSPTQRLKIFAYQMVLSPAAASAIPTDSELVIQPSGETPICVRVTTQDKRQIVEVLWGEIILSSPNHPQGLKIRKGRNTTKANFSFLIRIFVSQAPQCKHSFRLQLGQMQQLLHLCPARFKITLT